MCEPMLWGDISNQDKIWKSTLARKIRTQKAKEKRILIMSNKIDSNRDAIQRKFERISFFFRCFLFSTFRFRRKCRRSWTATYGRVPQSQEYTLARIRKCFVRKKLLNPSLPNSSMTRIDLCKKGETRNWITRLLRIAIDFCLLFLSATLESTTTLHNEVMG